jgi:hypothetical protein
MLVQHLWVLFRVLTVVAGLSTGHCIYDSEDVR